MGDLSAIAYVPRPVVFYRFQTSDSKEREQRIAIASDLQIRAKYLLSHQQLASHQNTIGLNYVYPNL